MNDQTHPKDIITWRQAIEQTLRAAGQPLHYREIAHRIIASGFPSVGQTPEKTVSRELTTHPEVFTSPIAGDGFYELAKVTPLEELNFSPKVEEVFSIVEPQPVKPHHGQGFQSLVHVRRATELHAMSRAIAHFSGEGWQVDDVSARMPFDLRCTKATQPELRVEVKGTSGDGDSILLTRREVEHALDAYPNMALYILRRITVEMTEQSVVTYGGAPGIYLPWDARTGTLTPLNYSYSVGS